MKKTNETILVRSPLRISLSGGGTDFPEYFTKYGSLVISFAINKYTYLIIRRTPSIFSYKTKIQYSKIEQVDKNEDIKHNGVRGVLEYLNDQSGYDITYMCDIPAQTGMATSSSFIVNLLFGLHKLNNRQFTKLEIAKQAIDVERNLLKEPGGYQDQVAVSVGSFNQIIFSTDDVSIKKIELDDNFSSSFLRRSILMYTGKNRLSFELSKSYTSESNLESRHNILSLSKDMAKNIESGDISLMGLTLDKIWKNKKNIDKNISNPNIDKYYNLAIENGAIGGKLLGAGSEGFLFFFLKDGVDKEIFSEAVGLEFLDFDFDHSGVTIL